MIKKKGQQWRRPTWSWPEKGTLLEQVNEDDAASSLCSISSGAKELNPRVALFSVKNSKGMRFVSA
jgi:hypothetical protein